MATHTMVRSITLSLILTLRLSGGLSTITEGLGEIDNQQDMIITEYDNKCPSVCICGYINNTVHGYFHFTNCSHLGIDYIPGDVFAGTQYIDLSHNDLKNLSDDSVISTLSQLLVIDIRENVHLERLPMFTHNENLQQIYTDKGYTCCIYEIESGQGVDGTAECIATEPYQECSTHLVKVLTIIIYFVVVFFSLIFNPWIMIVTLCTRKRRKDPITYNAFHFSTSNILATIYAAVMLSYGIAYLGEYHYHMESWLSNPGCGTVGFLLITSTLVSAVLYMIEVICIFMKLRYPLKVDRHMTVRRLTICVLVTWCIAIVIASIPFMAERRYNVVGLCLPFYARDENTGFKFVIFYTAIMGTTVVVNTVLAVLLVVSFMRNRKRRNIEVPQLLINDLLRVEKKIFVALCVYIIIALINVSFLIMSCVGGHTGKVGREWYTRIVVIETVTYPLIGPLRAKRFFTDSAKLLRKWGCYRFPGIPVSTIASGSDFDRANSTRSSAKRLMVNTSFKANSQV